MDWKDLAGPLVGAGAPVLGKILGGLLPIPGGSLVGEAAGNLLAKALGVAPPGWYSLLSGSMLRPISQMRVQSAESAPARFNACCAAD